MKEDAEPVSAPSRCLANLAALATAVVEATELVTLRVVLGVLTQRFRLPRRVVAAELLSELGGASRGVTLFVLSSRAEASACFYPARDEPEGGDGAAPVWCRPSHAQKQPDRVPRRVDILAALRASWVEGDATVPVDLEEFASISCADAASRFDHFPRPPLVGESVVVGNCSVASNDAAGIMGQEAGREVSRGDLVKGSLQYDQACIALFRERQRLEGTHRPMQALVQKYNLSDGKLRACIRDGERLCEPEVDNSRASVFHLADALRADGPGMLRHRHRA